MKYLRNRAARKPLCATLSMLMAAVTIGSCSSDSGDDKATAGGPGTQTYSATLTEVQIARSADQQPMPVAGLPAPGAQITVR